jgi:hypothetical protein
MTQPRVGAIVDRVLALAQNVLRDWVHVEAWLPPELAQPVREMEAGARAKVAEHSQ